jgi:hypothetical protein
VGRWLADILRITDDGTEYVQPSKIVLPIMTAPSHHVPHLQPADFVVATTAVIAGRKAGLDLKELLAKVMHLHSPGDVNGVGVVLFPPDYNLYYHAFGETSRSQCPKRVSPTAPTTPSATVGTRTDDAHEHRPEPAIRLHPRPCSTCCVPTCAARLATHECGVFPEEDRLGDDQFRQVTEEPCKGVRNCSGGLRVLMIERMVHRVGEAGWVGAVVRGASPDRVSVVQGRSDAGARSPFARRGRSWSRWP